MAKIDTSKIAGYESMSAEEKLAALEGYEFSDVVSKSVLDKATSEAAEWKRKYNSTLSEAEQARIAAEEAAKATSDRLAELERKDKISTAKDRYIKSGFTPELALATAEAFVDGNMDAVLENVSKHATEVATAARDAALKDTPAPPAGGSKAPLGKAECQKRAEEAAANGDFTAAAYYQRLSIMEE